MTRIFLAIVGAIYAALAVWCSVAPGKTSETVGLQIKPGAGQSEFLTVYGGLEMALGIVFFWPLFRQEFTAYALLVCLIVHACLVVFRTIGFFLYPGIPSTTYGFAASEWLIFLLAAACYFWRV